MPNKKDSGPASENKIERILASSERKKLLAATLGFPPMATAKINDSAVSSTKAIPKPTAHLPERVLGIKFIFI